MVRKGDSGPWTTPLSFQCLVTDAWFSHLLTSAKASQEFAEKAGDKVTLKIWTAWYHEIHNEPEKKPKS